jgi:hypothetical protein
MKRSSFWNISQTRNQCNVGNLLHDDFLLDLFFNPEDGSNMMIQNFTCLSTDYMALYPRRQYFSYRICSKILLREVKVQCN